MATLMCNGCKTAKYCSKGCQTVQWATHKFVCRALATRIAAAPEDDVPVTTALTIGPYVLTYYQKNYESDNSDKTLPVFSIKLDSEWTETFTMNDELGIFGMYDNKPSIERVLRLRKFVHDAADAENDGAMYVVRDFEGRAFIVYNESDMAAYRNTRVWFVDDPPKVLKWIRRPQGSPFPRELSTARKLSNTVGVSVPSITNTFGFLAHPRDPLNTYAALLMPKYPYETLTEWIKQHPRTDRDSSAQVE